MLSTVSEFIFYSSPTLQEALHIRYQVIFTSLQTLVAGIVGLVEHEHLGVGVPFHWLVAHTQPQLKCKTLGTIDYRGASYYVRIIQGYWEVLKLGGFFRILDYKVFYFTSNNIAYS